MSPAPSRSYAPSRSRAPLEAAPASAAPSVPPWLLGDRAKRIVLAASAAAVVSFAWWALRSGADAEENAAPASSPAKESRPVRPCTLSGEARKLADAVHLGVPLALQQVGSGRVALGYAASTTEAVGLTLDPMTLDAARAFSEGGSEKVLGVLPLSREDGRGGFATSRARKKSDNGGLVALSAGLAHLSAGERGLEVRLDGSTELLWPGAAAPQNTSPRAEPLGSSGALLTWRRGGLDGDIVVGLLDPRGLARGSAAKIASEAKEFGTPSPSVGEEEVLVTFASRSASDRPWRIELSRAPLGQLPATSRIFVPEGLSESASTLSPAATALPGGGWLLQWTQGENGKHRVWLQTLDHELAPVGPPLAAAPADAESGQGIPWAGADRRAAAFYIVRAGQQWELWGTALECPR